jgi:NADPH-dependent glutamate synthase beta subunit-like oxidoreductase/Pyruvate/2-oxoacid:ferredoxin oxidoreductase delta subunit
METVTLSINGEQVTAKKGTTVLEAAQEAGIYIPRLCFHPGLPYEHRSEAIDTVYQGNWAVQGDARGKVFEGCRLCVISVEGQEEPVCSCETVVSAGMVAHTDTAGLQEYRKKRLSTILASHPHACLTCAQREGCAREPCSTNVPVNERCCPQFNTCELRKVAEYIGIKENISKYVYQSLPVVNDEPFFIHNYNLCIGCLRCVRACHDLRGVGALGFVYQQDKIVVGTVSPTLKESGCKFCGSCVEVCPTGALTDKDLKSVDRESVLVPCRNTCPAGIDVPRYLNLIEKGKFDQALAVIRQKVPFPGVLGRVCFHPCEQVCRRGQLTEPVAICSLKRFVADQDTGFWKTGVKPAPSTGKQVGIIGSGPAGLAAAYYLARLGHQVTVFESLHEPGGMMRAGIPAYRLPRVVLDAEIEEIKKAGVEIVTGKKITSLSELLEKGCDAVFVATGAHQGMKIGIPGEDLPGMMDGVTFLRKVNLGDEAAMSGKVAVIGGGNVAVDAARVALRLGAGGVTILYRRTREEMPAGAQEVEEAIKEGIKIMFLVAPVEVSSSNGNLHLQCLRMELGEADKSGRKRPVPVAGSEFKMEFNTIIAAVGQVSEIPDNVEKNGKLIKVEPSTLAAGRGGIFAGGDVVSGPASVIEAIAMGRKAATSIDKYLGGTGAIEEVLVPLEEPSFWLGREEGFADRRRVAMPAISIEQRRGSFCEVETGLSNKMAVQEAGRCLKCDLRLRIPSVVLPPEKWLEFNTLHVNNVPEKEGVYRLLDEHKNIIFIAGTINLRRDLEKHLGSDDPCMKKACYFDFEEEGMYTIRESELIQQFLQQHGKLPEGNDILDDLF